MQYNRTRRKFTGAWCSPSDTSQSILRRPHCRGYRPSTPHIVVTVFIFLIPRVGADAVRSVRRSTSSSADCNAWRRLLHRPLSDVPRKPTSDKALSMCPVAGTDRRIALFIHLYKTNQQNSPFSKPMF